MLRMYEILEKLFAHDIFHSDIKPENFILDKSSDWRYYTIKIIDFGVSGIGDFTSFRGYTPQYAMDGDKGEFKFSPQSKEERLVYEYY